MRKGLCFLLLFITGLTAGAQRLGIGPGLSITATPTASVSVPSRIISLGGGEFRFKPTDRVGFEGHTINMLHNDFGRIQRNSMLMAGFNVLLYRLQGFSAQVSVSPGFGMRQSILNGAYRENVTFEGLFPVFALGLGVEYKISRHLGLFTRIRWIGGDVTDQGTADYRYGRFILHTGFHCKITAPKRHG